MIFLPLAAVDLWARPRLAPFTSSGTGLATLTNTPARQGQDRDPSHWRAADPHLVEAFDDEPVESIAPVCRLELGGQSAAGRFSLASICNVTESISPMSRGAFRIVPRDLRNCDSGFICFFSGTRFCYRRTPRQLNGRTNFAALALMILHYALCRRV